jgi:hypothetical protein
MYRMTKIKQNSRKVSFYSLSILLALAAVVLGLKPGVANAGTLTQTLVRFDRLQTSTQTTGTVCVKPTSAGTAASVQVAYPTGYTLSSTLGNWTVTTTNLGWPATATAWPGIGTATAVAAQVVTFPSTTLTVGTLYCFNWSNSAAVQITASVGSNNTGTVTTRTSVPATIDAGSYSTVSLASDQIGVTAAVPQAFTYSLSGTSDALGNLSTGAITSSPTPRTLTINTNANSGWLAWVQDANTGLHSTAGSYTFTAAAGAGNNSTLTNGIEGFNMGVTSSQTSGTGTVTVAAGYVGGVSGKGGGLDTTLRSIASSTGTANNAVLTLTNNATISSTTTAATDYSDTITLPAAAMF